MYLRYKKYMMYKMYLIVRYKKVHNNRVQNVPTKRKGKENKENIYRTFDSYTENDELITTLKDFAEMRKEIKKPLTTKRAITMLLSKLDKLASTDEEKKLILEQSIFNNWQGVFPLKVENKQVPGKITIEDTVLDMFLKEGEPMERFNLDIEKALLGNCINSKETFVKVLDRGGNSNRLL